MNMFLTWICFMNMLLTWICSIHEYVTYMNMLLTWRCFMNMLLTWICSWHEYVPEINMFHEYAPYKNISFMWISSLHLPNGQFREMVDLRSYKKSLQGYCMDDPLGSIYSDRYRGVVDLWRWSVREVRVIASKSLDSTMVRMPAQEWQYLLVQIQLFGQHLPQWHWFSDQDPVQADCWI